MGAIDLATLLKPVSDGAPSGEDLEYDSAFVELEQAAQGKPEQQYGDTIIPAEEPDWKQVKRLAGDLLGRSKDLRVAVYWARASLVVDTINDFADVLELIGGYVRDFWPTVHPQLDPDDDNDPTIRVNTMGMLNDFASTITLLREATIVSSRRLGRYSFQDYEIASGEVPAPADMEHKPDLGSIEAAFMDCELGELRSERDSVSRALTAARDLTDLVTTEIGAAETVSLQELESQLKHIEAFLNEQLAKRGSGESTPDEQVEQDTAAGNGSATPADATAPRQAAGRLTGEITTREDVIRALDKICTYYERYEPSSPVPLLLKRAKRLATLSFLDILRDLTPDGVNQAVAIGGIMGAGGGSSESGSAAQSQTEHNSHLDDL